MSPGVPVPVKVGVLMEVMPSVLESPVSELAARSGVPGATGGTVTIVTESGAESLLKVPLASETFAVSECTPSASVLVVIETLPAAMSSAVSVAVPTSTPLS